MTTVSELCHDLVFQIEEIKEKITDSQYKFMIELVKKQHDIGGMSNFNHNKIKLTELFTLIATIHNANESVLWVRLGSFQAFKIIGMQLKHWTEGLQDNTALQKRQWIFSELLSAHAQDSCVHEMHDDMNEYNDDNIDRVVCSCALERFYLSDMRKVMDKVEEFHF